MPPRGNGLPASYVAYNPDPPPGRVFGSFVSSPYDVHRDAPRLYGRGTRWVAKSKAPRALLGKARLAEKGGRPVPLCGPDGKPVYEEPA